MADNSKTRGSNFTTVELNQLCSSWSHISQDPIVGNGQKLTAFWERTVRHYNANKPLDKETRNIRSLDSKWSDLKRDVAKFSGCYQSVLDANHSGDCLEDTLRRSKELYAVKDSKGKEFTFSDQWNLLKDCPRFALTIEDMNQKIHQKKARKQKGKGRMSIDNEGDKENDSPIGDESVFELDADEGGGVGQRPGYSTSSSLHFGEHRPMGNKVAKKQRGDESATKIMAAAQREMAAISSKRLRLAEKQDRESLLTLRVADVDPECQAYFRACRAKELRIAMAKLAREEEEELAAIRGTSRTPLPRSNSVEEPLPTVHNAQSFIAEELLEIDEELA